MGQVMSRVENWQLLLQLHIDSYESKVFKWRDNDCTRFVAEWLDAAIGTKHTQNIPTNYKTERGAYRILRKHYGVKSLSDLLTRELGDEYINPMYAQRGDIIASHTHPDFSDAFGCALGICVGSEVAFFGPGKQGLEFPSFIPEVVAKA